MESAADGVAQFAQLEAFGGRWRRHGSDPFGLVGRRRRRLVRRVGRVAFRVAGQRQFGRQRRESPGGTGGHRGPDARSARLQGGARQVATALSSARQ